MWPSMRLGGLVGHGSWVTRGSISERCCRGSKREMCLKTDIAR
jgi:hypothetical protein